ncbi:hypothetical protein BC829DRAFT_491184 [Chytridium lagenaria]|nr:hypothetical protein BC829DRAFT_491184 [Chytridium lagenaria]
MIKTTANKFMSIDSLLNDDAPTTSSPMEYRRLPEPSIVVTPAADHHHNQSRKAYITPLPQPHFSQPQTLSTSSRGPSTPSAPHVPPSLPGSPVYVPHNHSSASNRKARPDSSAKSLAQEVPVTANLSVPSSSPEPSTGNKRKRCRTVFSLITPHDYKTGSHSGHNAGATYVSEWDNQQQQQQQAGASTTSSSHLRPPTFSTPPPSPSSTDCTDESLHRNKRPKPSTPSTTDVTASPSSTTTTTSPGFICPLAHCTASFLRRYNMVQHFRAHAARIGISSAAVEKGCKALKGVPEGCVPEFFAVGGGSPTTIVNNRSRLTTTPGFTFTPISSIDITSLLQCDKSSNLDVIPQTQGCVFPTSSDAMEACQGIQSVQGFYDEEALRNNEGRAVVLFPGTCFVAFQPVKLIKSQIQNAYIKDGISTTNSTTNPTPIHNQFHIQLLIPNLAIHLRPGLYLYLIIGGSILLLLIILASPPSKHSPPTPSTIIITQPPPTLSSTARPSRPPPPPPPSRPTSTQLITLATDEVSDAPREPPRVPSVVRPRLPPPPPPSKLRSTVRRESGMSESPQIPPRPHSQR